jgi:hypothetical protein
MSFVVDYAKTVDEQAQYSHDVDEGLLQSELDRVERDLRKVTTTCVTTLYVGFVSSGRGVRLGDITLVPATTVDVERLCNDIDPFAVRAPFANYFVGMVITETVEALHPAHVKEDA